MQVGELVNRLLAPLGLKIQRLSRLRQDSLDFDSVFLRLANRSVEIATVIDIGASNGCWSEKVLPFWPEARCLLIEGNDYHASGLKAFCKRHARADYVMAVASHSDGTVAFDATDPWTGAASLETAPGRDPYPAVSVDAEIERRKLTGPFLLKLDTHGFEVPILEGSRRTLAQTRLLVVEAYNFQVAKDSLYFWELCAWLAERNFRPVDIMEPMHRPRDGAFWQADILFQSAHDPVFDEGNWG